MNRRSFTTMAACFATQVPQLVRPQARNLSRVCLNGTRGRTVPSNFTGLSYELSQLTEPAFFSSAHVDLVGLFRSLSPAGILRIGGNTSEFCWFRAKEETVAPKLPLPRGDVTKNWMPHRLFEITKQAIDNLRDFLDATGWTAIYGLNFGNSTPARAAEEAAYVSRVLGDRLFFFQIGNEPDFYRDANNGVRPAGWGFEDYVREWTEYADAVSELVPHAVFGGPDTGASSDWVTRFGNEIAPRLKGRLVALSGHYYAEGPPNDPKVTTERLLAGTPHVAKTTDEIVRVADANNLTYHMSEGNSCYRGGKPGMSNAFAASLWAADYLLTLALHGCSGVNLHGGTSKFLSAGLGDHNPGLDVPGVKKQVPNGFYTPIATEPDMVAEARPVFYGMLFAQQFAGATMLGTDAVQSEKVSVFAARKKEESMVAVVNKGSTSVTVPIKAGSNASRGRVLRLTAPSLDSTSDVRFGGAVVRSTGPWTPRPERIAVRSGEVSLSVPAFSASLLLLS